MDSFFENFIDNLNCLDFFIFSDEFFFLLVDWFILNISVYYKRNLKIGYLNVNSIYGKVDEVFNLFNMCWFDIFFIVESKIDGLVSSFFFVYFEYCIIWRDRKKGVGGMLVYIWWCIIVFCWVKLEFEGVELICIDVKGCGNLWFLICVCYCFFSKCKIFEFLLLCVLVVEKMYLKWKEVVFFGDFNIDMLLENGFFVRLSYNFLNFCD